MSEDKSTLVTKWWEVPASSLFNAELLLADSACIELTPALLGLDGWGTTAQAISHTFGFSRLPEAGGHSYCLVRALYLPGAGGGFDVFWEDGSVLVKCTRAGNGDEGLARTALIVLVPSEPEAAYAYCRVY